MNIKHKEVLPDAFEIEYEHTISFFQHTLERLIINKYICDKIKSYPLNFIIDEYNIFFQNIYNNAAEINLLICSKLLIDKPEDFLNLKNFKNKVCQKFKSEKEEELTQFKLQLKELDTFHKESEIEDKIKEIRNYYIAHHKKEIINNSNKIEKIGLKDFNDLIKYIENYIKILSMDTFPLFLNTSLYHKEYQESTKTLPVFNAFVEHMTDEISEMTDLDKLITILEDNSSVIKQIINDEDLYKLYAKEFTKKQKKYLKEVLERNKIFQKLI